MVNQCQTNGQYKLDNKAIQQDAWECKVEGNKWLQKLFEIQLKVSFRDNTARQNSSFFSLLGF